MNKPLALIFALCSVGLLVAAWMAYCDGEPHRSGLIAAALTALTALIVAKGSRVG